MNICPGCGRFEPPDWDHEDDCPVWPGTEWNRRYGHMEDCGGLTGCEETHEYLWHYQCGCEGECFYCSHIGCEGCLTKSWADRPWWRKLLTMAPGPRRHGWQNPVALSPR